MSPGYPFNIRLKGQWSRSQGHRVQKQILVEGDRVAGVRLHSIPPASSLYHFLDYRILLLYFISLRVVDEGT